MRENAQSRSSAPPQKIGVDALDQLIGQLVGGFTSQQVFIQLLQAGGAGDHAADFLAAQDPGDGQLGGGQVQLAGDIGQLPDTLAIRSGVIRSRIQAISSSEARLPSGIAVVVLAGEDADSRAGSRWSAQSLVRGRAA